MRDGSILQVRDSCRAGHTSHRAYEAWSNVLGPTAAWEKIEGHRLYFVYLEQAQRWSRACSRVNLVTRLIERHADASTGLGAVLLAKAALWQADAWEDGAGKFTPESEHWRALDIIGAAAGAPT